jgi:hypothetical protein
MNTNAKLAVISVGLALSAVVLVVSLRAHRDGDASLASVRPSQTLQTPAEVSERHKAIVGFRKAMIEAHDRTLKDLIDALDYSGRNFCAKGRRSLQYSMEIYAHTRFTFNDLAVTQDFMSDEAIAEVWNGPSDVTAVNHANFRLRHGFVMREDFPDWRATYMKIFSFPEDVAAACPGPIPRG